MRLLPGPNSGSHHAAKERAENTENRNRGSIIDNIENRESEITDVVWMIKTENREQTVENRD